MVLYSVHESAATSERGNMAKKDDGEDNIRVMPTKPSAIAASVEVMNRDMESILQGIEQQAKVRWAYYQGLKKEGFTDVQALYLTGELFKESRAPSPNGA